MAIATRLGDLTGRWLAPNPLSCSTIVRFERIQDGLQNFMISWQGRTNNLLQGDRDFIHAVSGSLAMYAVDGCREAHAWFDNTFHRRIIEEDTVGMRCRCD